MNILITGIHGFVGSNLVEALREEHKIYGLDIVAPEKPGVLKTFGWSDLAVIPPMDVVIHLAGVAHDTKNRTEAQRYYDVNTGLTQKVFDWFQTTEAKKFIFFSSVKAAADQLFDKVLTEDVIPTPVGPYGESKIAAENYVLGHQLEAKNRLLAEYEHHEVISKVQTVYILRPCMIHGAGNKGNLNLLFNFVRSGIPYPLGAFENKRSFTSVDNMSYVVERLIALPIPGGIYNIGDDDQVSTNEIKVIMNKCPELFKEDLIFLNNSVKNKKINYEENEFLFYSMKYFYIIDKNYILNTIKSNKYESEEANLLKEKVLLEK